MPKIKEVKRMTGAMRTIHLVNALCMVVAVITGLYIGHPYYQALIADSAVDKYVMAWNRWGHFIVAIIFDVTAVLIGYLYFFSRFEQPYKKILPTGKNIKEFIATDWTLSLFGGNIGVRIAHHTSMYFILVWVMCHIYYQVWRTIFWQEGEIAIVVSGSKFVQEKDKKD